MRCRLLRPAAGETFNGVLLGGLTDLKMHWFQNKLYPCTECGQCPYCPGRPDKICYRWYGAAAAFTSEMWTPAEEDWQLYHLKRKAGQEVEAPRARKINTLTELALAEIPDAEIVNLGDREREGLVLEWSKGPNKNSPVKVKVLGAWQQSKLWPEFDWLPAAERILNSGRPIRLPEAKNDDGKILKFRKQA